MSFGWSAGDIVAALQLLNKVRIALKDSGGAKTDYQDATVFLDTLLTTLTTLKDVQDTSTHTELPQGISDHVVRLREEINQFLQELQKDYGDSLGSFPTCSPFKIQARKIQYATSKKVQDLRAKINPELSALQIRLMGHILNVCAKLPFHLQRQMEHATKATLESFSLNQKHEAILNKLVSHDIIIDGIFKQTSNILSVSENSQARMPLEMFPWPAEIRTTLNTVVGSRDEWEVLSSIVQNGQQAALGLIGVVKDTMCLLSMAVMAGYRKTVLPFYKTLALVVAQTVAHSGIRLIDPLGRKTTIPYDCGRSWEMFNKFIHLLFKDCPGEDLVRDGMYCFTDTRNSSNFFAANSWSQRIRDGATVQMFMIVVACIDCGGRTFHDSTKRTAICQYCKKGYVSIDPDNIDLSDTTKLRSKLDLLRLRAEAGGTASTTISHPQSISHGVVETRHLKHVVNINAYGIFPSEYADWAIVQLWALADAVANIHGTTPRVPFHYPSVEELMDGIAFDAHKGEWRQSQR